MGPRTPVVLGPFQKGSEVAVLGNAGSVRKSRNTKLPELRFRALLDEDGTRQIELARP